MIGGETGGRWLGGNDRQIRALLLSPFVGQKLSTADAQREPQGHDIGVQPPNDADRQGGRTIGLRSGSRFTKSATGPSGRSFCVASLGAEGC
jgi:hypothetical protein